MDVKLTTNNQLTKCNKTNGMCSCAEYWLLLIDDLHELPSLI